MTDQRRTHPPAALMRLACALLLLVQTTFAGSATSLDQATVINHPPELKPDYAGVTIPPNIAPLNFLIREPGTRFHVRIRGKSGSPIEIETKSPRILISPDSWRSLLTANKGSDLVVEVSAQTNNQQWVRFAAITNTVATEDIDPVLIYRKIHPSHNSWSWMGLFQRNLTTFEETPFLENKRFSGSCCHCHMLRNNDPNWMMALVRSSIYKNSALVITNGVAGAIGGQVGFVSWHPKAPLIAASFSKPRLMIHSARNDMRDITELEGWIGYFTLDSKIVKKVPGLDDHTRLMAFPAWAPDGRYLYYCSAPNPLATAPALVGKIYEDERYDLMRISYNLDRDEWGKPEPVLLVRDTGLSMAQPRMSPDGRWLYVCGIPYGCWPAYNHTSDIYGVDLREGEASGKFTCKKLSLNSDECESWLSWSLNSRWVVFSSKRVSPLFNRPHIAYIAPDGSCGKPFILPQRDPEFYDSQLRTYTIPTLAIGPIKVPQRDLVNSIKYMGKATLTMPDVQASKFEDNLPPVQ